MKIEKILSQHRNDFTAILVCEHCGHQGKLNNGYHDDFYHTQVIPSIECGGCGLNSDGTTEPRKHVNAFVL